jgi:hypothetical protein
MTKELEEAREVIYKAKEVAKEDDAVKYFEEIVSVLPKMRGNAPVGKMMLALNEYLIK